MEKGHLNTREIVYDMLDGVIRQGRKASDVSGQALGVYSWADKRDRAFMSRLFLGVLEYRVRLDEVIRQFSSLPPEKMKPSVRLLLEMGSYQILYMDHVPDAAVCNETVALAKKRAPRGLSGFVNGVLRGIARGKDQLQEPDRDGDPAAWLSWHCSLPAWLSRMWIEELGLQKAAEIGEAALARRGISVRVRTQFLAGMPGEDQGKGMSALVREMGGEGVSMEPARMFPDALYISGFDTLARIPAFADGRLTVQDESSMIPVLIAGIGGTDRVIDLCAAPGGKSVHAADMMNASYRQMISRGRIVPEGRVLARDISPDRADRIRENVERLHLRNVKVELADALELKEEERESADVVLADLPCSGLGVIGRKPDIKLHASPEQIRELASLQRQMLDTAACLCRPGGTLIYSTCTISRQENEDNLAWFLENYPFEIDPAGRFLPYKLRHLQAEEGFVKVLPSDYGTDGFFAVRLIKRTGADG